MKEIILLGAGASKKAGVPLSTEMSSAVAKLMERKPDESKSLQALRFCASALMFQQGASGGDPFGGIDIESLLNALDMLSRKDQLEIAPFVSGWHPAIASIGAPDEGDQRRGTRDLLDAARWSLYWSHGIPSGPFVQRQDKQAPSEKMLLARFHAGFMLATRLATGTFSNSWIFEHTRTIMTRSLAELTWLDDQQQVEYLKPLVKHCYEHKKTLATLNYDNTIELCAEDLSIAVDTGMDAWTRFGAIDFPTNDKLKLLKLHGSITWVSESTGGDESRPVGVDMFREALWHERPMEGRTPGIILGGHNKLTAKGPFLELFQSFQSDLMKAKGLTVIGYSFRDDHVNQLIGRWLNADASRTIRLINGDKFDTDLLCERLGASYLGIEGRVENMNTYAEFAIPDIYS